jgi:hypothetical protein
MMGWAGSEAWIFLSIGDAARDGQATLDGVIGAADANNHAIPTVGEFEQAVGQLLGAGLITATPKDYALTPEGRELYAIINSVDRGHITRFIDTGKEWRARAPSEAAAVKWSVDPKRFDEAYLQYSRRAQKVIRKLTKGQKPGR